MQNIFYFKLLYEYEQQHGNLQIIKNYIHGKNANLLRDFCTGKINIPSPFLLEEIEVVLNRSNDRVKEIIYQLKVMSQEFYTSLIEVTSGTYPLHFAESSATLGQNIICYLIELRLYNTGSKDIIINRVKISLYKKFLFATIYHKFLDRLFGLNGIFSFTIFWGICITVDLAPTFITFLLSTMICTFSIMGAFSFKNKINIFEYSSHRGKNLLIIKYKEFFGRLERNSAVKVNIIRLSQYHDRKHLQQEHLHPLQDFHS